MGKHTPGPWNRSFESVDPEWAAVTTSGGAVIANVNADCRQEANTTLIAAAPDLLEGLLWFARYHSFPEFAHQEECKATEATGGNTDAITARLMKLDLLFERLGIELNPSEAVQP